MLSFNWQFHVVQNICGFNIRVIKASAILRIGQLI